MKRRVRMMLRNTWLRGCRLVELLAERFKHEHASIRLSPIVVGGPVSNRDMVRKLDYDLAVVASSPAMSADWPVVAILRQNALVLMALNRHGLEPRGADVTVDGAIHPAGSTLRVLYRADWSDEKLDNPPADETLVQ